METIRVLKPCTIETIRELLAERAATDGRYLSHDEIAHAFDVKPDKVARILATVRDADPVKTGIAPAQGTRRVWRYRVSTVWLARELRRKRREAESLELVRVYTLDALQAFHNADARNVSASEILDDLDRGIRTHAIPGWQPDTDPEETEEA
jgi:hypothetical protein